MNDKKCTIYVLYEPYANVVRYVGQTTKKLTRRLSEHIISARNVNNSHLHHWINKCLTENGFVGCVPIQEDAEWNVDEIKWIAKFKSEGYDLVNSTQGGDGTIGFIPSTETRQKMSVAKIGKPISEKERSLLLYYAQKSKSEEYRSKISKTLLGHSVSEETRHKISIKNTGHISPRRKKILCVETGEVFQSLTEAAKTKCISISHLPAACNGKRKSAGGFTWRYA